MQNNYIVTFGECSIINKASLEHTLKKGKYNCKVNDNTWIVKTSLPPSNLRNYIISFLDKNTTVFVAELRGNAAWRNANNITNFYLNKY